MADPSKLTKEDKKQISIARFDKPEELKKWKPKEHKYIFIPINRTFIGMRECEKPKS